MPAQGLHARFVGALVFSVACALAVPAPAQTLPSDPGNTGPEAMLGLAEKALTSLYPALKKMRKPIAGLGGSQGRWTLPDAVLGDQTYDGTVFLSASKVSRVEYINAASQENCRSGFSFERAKAFLTQRFGESQANGTMESHGNASYSLAFSDETTDASLYLSESPNLCLTRIVYKLYLEKGADTL